ncbi:MAG: protein-export chaperone SecB [Proteobacteria bacterium]|nr:protein-export chaperone SecB [Pseudomonadota bacterium]
MAETDPPGAAPDAAPGGAPGARPQVRILAHFVRDLSFENVGAIEGTAAQGAPEISVQVNLDGQNIGEDRYQVNMKLTAKAVDGEHTRFLVELDYAGIFSITNAPPEQIHPMMFIECPRLILPFARRVVADATRDGGYPPLMLDNVDFAALYLQKLEQLREEKRQKEQPN